MLKLRYPVAVSDFDGTLLRNDNKISQHTRGVIKELVEAGGSFFIATGRMHRAIINRLEEAGLGGLDVPVISYQGALVKSAITDKVLYDSSLDLRIVTDVINEARARNIYIHAYIDDTLYVEKEMSWTTGYTNFLGITFTEVGDLLKFVTQKLSDKNEHHSCHKLLMMMEHEIIENELKHFLNKFGGGMDFENGQNIVKKEPRALFNTSSVHLLECVAVNAGKDKAIEHVVKDMGYTLDNVMAIGDSLNDYSMVLRAGMGVAVQNADDRVKQVAKYIAPSNDDDGVAHAIEKLILMR
jgi:Cof subfamily protein (haloacid dehalogenase superfamily)